MARSGSTWSRRRSAMASSSSVGECSPSSDDDSPKAWWAACSRSSSRDRIRMSPVQSGLVRAEDQRAHVGRLALAVAVDAAVALLDRDQRPGKVEVDQVVALAGGG